MTVLFVAGAAIDAGVLSARSVTGEPGAAPPATTADQRSELEQFMAHGAADSARHSARRREGADREVQRLPVSGLRPVVPGVQADPRQVRSAGSGRRAGGAEGLPAQRELQPEQLDAASGARATRRSPSAWRASTIAARQMEEWLYTNQPGMTPAIGPSRRRARSDRSPISTRSTPRRSSSSRPTSRSARSSASTRRRRSSSTASRSKGQWAPQYFDQAIAYELQHPPAQ